jgi:hypothetical protein
MLKPKPNPLPKPHFAKNKLPFPLTIKILQLIYFHRELLIVIPWYRMILLNSIREEDILGEEVFVLRAIFYS